MKDRIEEPREANAKLRYPGDQHFSRSPEMRRYNKTCVASGNPSGGAAYSWQCNVEFRKDTQQGKVRA